MVLLQYRCKAVAECLLVLNELLPGIIIDDYLRFKNRYEKGAVFTDLDVILINTMVRHLQGDEKAYAKYLETKKEIATVKTPKKRKRIAELDLDITLMDSAQIPHIKEMN